MNKDDEEDRTLDGFAKYDLVGKLTRPASDRCSTDRCKGTGDCVKCCPGCDSLRSYGYDDGPCGKHSTRKSRD